MSMDRFEDLYERYVDGTLDPAERTEFLAFLGDPAFRTRFVELSAYEAAIGEELKVTAPAEENKKASAKMRAVGGNTSKRIPIVHVRPAPRAAVAHWQIFGGIAAAFVLVAILILASGPSEEGRRRPPAPSVAGTPPPVTPPRIEPMPAPVPEKIKTPEKRVAPTFEVPPRPVLETPPVQPIPPKPVVPVPPPPVRREAETRPETQPARESVTFIAKIERVVGDVKIGTDVAEAGKGVASGQGVSAGAGGYAVVRFPDGTKLELGMDTVVSRVADGATGKSVQVERGLVAVEAAKQPTGKALVLSTPFAESTVVGTEFTLWTTAAFTRLDVKEGRVKFARPGGVTSVVVGAGHYAIAGPGFDFTAKPLPSLWKAPAGGLMLWLRADAMKGPSQWPDLSPAGNHGTQPVTASQPTLVANAAGTQPAVHFDGKAQHYVLPDGFADFKAGLSAFVVVRPAPGGPFSRFIDLDVGPACDNIVFGRKDAPDKLGFWVYANSQTRGKVEAPGAIVADQLQSFGAVLALGGRVTLYKNGGAVATGQTSVPVSVSRKPNMIGKSNTSGDPYFKGDLFEILLFNRALADTERQFVDGYINAKYFDPTSPPPMNRPADK